MKNQFIITLLCLSLIGTIATAQTKKPTTTTKKPSTTVKSTVPKTTTKTSTTTTTTIPKSTTAPVVVEEKKTTTTTTTTTPAQTNSSSVDANSTSNSTTIQQSSGPSKGGKKPAETRTEKIKEPKPERVREPRPERVREPKPEKVRNPSSSSDGTGVHFGIKGGVNNLFFTGGGKVGDGSFSATPSFAIGFHGGLVANIGISELFAIQPEVLYVQQNAKFAEGNDNLTIDGSAIEIPIALQFNLGSGPTKFFINLGGYGSYALTGGVSGTVGGTTIPKTAFDYTGVSFSDRTDYGAIAGIGLKFNQSLFIEARGNYSLKDGSFTDSAGKKVVPVFAGLSLGYFF
jgi:Outer membrane protein beta-barrel domain